MVAGCGSRGTSRPTGVPTSPVTRERISARSIDSANPCGQPRRRSHVTARSRAVHYHDSNRLRSWGKRDSCRDHIDPTPNRWEGSPTGREQLSNSITGSTCPSVPLCLCEHSPCCR